MPENIDCGRDSGDRKARRQLRLLVVDDSQEVLQSLGDCLRSFDHEVTLALGPREALALYEPGKFDVVLTDLCMPGMNGESLAGVIAERSPGQRTLVMSARQEVIRWMNGGGSPISAFLPKPFEVEEFLNIVDRLIDVDGTLPSGTVL